MHNPLPGRAVFNQGNDGHHRANRAPASPDIKIAVAAGPRKSSQRRDAEEHDQRDAAAFFNAAPRRDGHNAPGQHQNGQEHCVHRDAEQR